MSNQSRFHPPSERAQARARITGTTAKAATPNLKRTTHPKNEPNKLSCPRHNEPYVLRHNRLANPTMLIYECPIEGCLNTYQDRVIRR